MAVFASKPTVTVAAYETGTNQKLSISGITSDLSVTPDTAATQINKFLDIVGRSVGTLKMERTVKQEAAEE